MTNIVKSLLVLSCAALIGVAGCSKEPEPSQPVVTTGTIGGRITDIENGIPLSGVVVNSIPPSQSVTTDGSGYYRMYGIPAGTYNLRAVKNAYSDAFTAVSVAAGQTTTADIVMRSGAVTDNNPPSVASNPTPADNSTNIPRAVTLRWGATDPDGDAMTYDVYVGTSNPPGTSVATAISATSFAPLNLDSNTTYYWFVLAKDSKGATTVGPVWRFKTQGGTGGPNEGKGGTAIFYSAGSGYISVPHASAFSLNDGSFTVEAWVNTTALTGNTDLWNVILNKSHMNSDIDYLLGIDGDGRFCFITRSLSNFIRSTVKAELGRWYHVAGVQNVGTGKVSVYIDGVLAKEAPLEGAIMHNNAPLFIGAREYYGQGKPSDIFKGTIDEVRVWNVARSGGEILATKNSRLSGNEAGLIANFRFDEGNGNTTRDIKANFTGDLIGGLTWVASSAPIN